MELTAQIIRRLNDKDLKFPKEKKNSYLSKLRKINKDKNSDEVELINKYDYKGKIFSTFYKEWEEEQPKTFLLYELKNTYKIKTFAKLEKEYKFYGDNIVGVEKSDSAIRIIFRRKSNKDKAHKPLSPKAISDFFDKKETGLGEKVVRGLCELGQGYELTSLVSYHAEPSREIMIVDIDWFDEKPLLTIALNRVSEKEIYIEHAINMFKEFSDCIRDIDVKNIMKNILIDIRESSPINFSEKLKKVSIGEKIIFVAINSKKTIREDFRVKENINKENLNKNTINLIYKYCIEFWETGNALRLHTFSEDHIELSRQVQKYLTVKRNNKIEDLHGVQLRVKLDTPFFSLMEPYKNEHLYAIKSQISENFIRSRAK